MKKEDVYGLAVALYEACEDMDAADYAENREDTIRILCHEIEDIIDSNPNSILLTCFETIVDSLL